MRRKLPTTVLCLLPALTGCLTRTHLVRRTHAPPIVYEMPLTKIVKDLNARYESIQTMSATVELVASTGGGKTGEVKEYPSFAGYIFLKKPEQLRVLLLVPVLRSKALDMVSDGSSFKLLIPPRNRAIVGTETVTQHSKNGLENLRPSVFLDSLLVRGPEAGQLVSRTLDTRLVDESGKRGDLIAEPDYDLVVLGQPDGQIVRTERVVHISRENLLPYRQDIYDADGQIVTRATYSNYQNFGAIRFPAKIVIERPLDEYSLTLTFTKITFNEKMEEDQFELKIPDGVPVQHME